MGRLCTQTNAHPAVKPKSALFPPLTQVLKLGTLTRTLSFIYSAWNSIIYGAQVPTKKQNQSTTAMITSSGSRKNTSARNINYNEPPQHYSVLMPQEDLDKTEKPGGCSLCTSVWVINMSAYGQSRNDVYILQSSVGVRADLLGGTRVPVFNSATNITSFSICHTRNIFICTMCHQVRLAGIGEWWWIGQEEQIFQLSIMGSLFGAEFRYVHFAKSILRQ